MILDVLDFIQKQRKEGSTGLTSSQAKVAISPPGELNASSYVESVLDVMHWCVHLLPNQD